MTEKQRPEEIRLIDWESNMRQGIEDAIANYEMFEIITFDPYTVTAGEDPRTWDEISENERQWILKDLFYRNHLDRQNEVLVDEYTFKNTSESSWTGVATVKVFKTKLSTFDNMYIHEITRPNCPTEYIVAPKEYRI